MPDEFKKELLLAKKTEEISRMAFLWLTSNVDKIYENHWDLRYGLLDEVLQYLITTQQLKNKENLLRFKWDNLFIALISQEEELITKKQNKKLTNGNFSKELISILKKIHNIYPDRMSIKIALDNFTDLVRTQDSTELYFALNDYYECLELEMKSEQISVSYGKNLILFLQSQLLVKKYQKDNFKREDPKNICEWIQFQEYNDYFITLHLCRYIKELLNFHDSIINKELINDFDNLNVNDCPFLKTDNLINKANEREGILVKKLIKVKRDTINQKHMLNEYVTEMYKDIDETKKDD
ncbi:hypothetical protein AB1L12_04720 [Peribacillus frigoritolerans]|uniref:hypothetical protein n=1 Tax=Peribacillus frigoritolerans TaxID=450367 RepID=UPI0039A00B45